MSVARRVYLDTARENVIVRSEQEYGEILAFNRACFNAHAPSAPLWNKNGWVKIASIPLVLIDLWKQRGLDFFDPNDWPILIRILNDSEWSHLRTAPGRI